MSTIGKSLTEAREDLALEIDEIASKTKIRAEFIEGMEADDFSSFASTTYAISFLKKYSQFLDVDPSDTVEELQSGLTQKLDSGKSQVKENLRASNPLSMGGTNRVRKPNKRGNSFFLSAILVLLAGGMTVFYIFGYNASSPEEAKEELLTNWEKVNPLRSEDKPASEAKPKVTDPDITLPELQLPEPTAPVLVPSSSTPSSPE
ncbi:MAG: helix-turn-helix domain-containing protein [Verrucomicrobiota bacterium]